MAAASISVCRDRYIEINIANGMCPVGEKGTKDNLHKDDDERERQVEGRIKEEYDASSTIDGSK